MADLVRLRLLTLRAVINYQLQQGNKLLAESDPEIFALIQKEKKRQIEGLELIASEVSFRPS
jgi:glycine/serine hydroxymethyltransferase